jgi:hypothetical protein
MTRKGILILACAVVGCLARGAEAETGRVAVPAGMPDAQTVERLRTAVTEGVSRKLESELDAERAELLRRLAARNRELLEERRRLEYEDPIAAGLKEKLVAAEKEVLALRRSLQARLDALEEIRIIEAERGALMQQLQELRNKAGAAEKEAGDR